MALVLQVRKKSHYTLTCHDTLKFSAQSGRRNVSVLLQCTNHIEKDLSSHTEQDG